MTFTPETQRRVMGCFATGVTVVTTRHGDELHGMTANAVASLSLNPPLLLIAVERNNHMHRCLMSSRKVAVNILARDQEHLSRKFAKAGPKDFSDAPWREVATGSPVLEGVIAFADCEVVDILPGGDHDIFIGKIIAGDSHEGRPLLYFHGKYHDLAE